MCDERIKQIADADAVLGRDGNNIVEAELIKFGRIRFQTRGVGFVRGDEHGLACAAQQARQLFVERRLPCAHVNDPDERDRFADRRRRLFQNVRRNDRIVALNGRGHLPCC